MTDLPGAVGTTSPGPSQDPETNADGDEGEDEDEVEPVELLVQLAEEGEIDPWDIDIVEVTDAFLDRLDDADLRTSGRALFYASVLLRMKSDALLGEDDPDDPEPEPWEARLEGEAPAMGTGGGEPNGAGVDPVDALEGELDRRLDRKHARGSPETLDELVRDLREAERGSWWKESRSYDTSGETTPRTQTLDYRAADDVRRDDEPSAAEVTERAHSEDIEATIADVRAALSAEYDAGRTEVLFREVRTAGGDAVHTFLALLFLDGRGVVCLAQDDLFGDLWIRNPDAEDADDGDDGDEDSGADPAPAADG
ncbi:MAG: segregation/condensation protein A [Haloferacaceae archaeon]